MYYIGIDLGGTNIAAGIVDESGTLLVKKSVPTPKDRGEDGVIEDMAKLAVTLVAENGYSMDDIVSVGIGSPGRVDKDAGVVISSANLPFGNTPLKEKMQNLLKKTVYIDNDANVAAWAESLAGAAKGAKHSVMVTLGTGVGGGIVIDGALYGGFNNMGAELGHLTLATEGEPKVCTCGRRGCWGAYASATALVQLTQKRAEENPESLLWERKKQDGAFNGKTAFWAAERGDKTAQAVLDEYITYLAEGVVSIAFIFHPEVIVIGGGVSGAGDMLYGPLRKQVAEKVYAGSGVPQERQPRIEPAKLGNDAGIVGAALLR